MYIAKPVSKCTHNKKLNQKFPTHVLPPDSKSFSMFANPKGLHRCIMLANLQVLITSFVLWLSIILVFFRKPYYFSTVLDDGLTAAEGPFYRSLNGLYSDYISMTMRLHNGWENHHLYSEYAARVWDYIK
jgi:hypothetical protein